MQIGKYQVDAGAEGTHEGGFQGYALFAWRDDAADMETKRVFAAVFPDMEQATQHAFEQAHALVAAGAI